jgi:hypothetical protein
MPKRETWKESATRYRDAMWCYRRLMRAEFDKESRLRDEIDFLRRDAKPMEERLAAAQAKVRAAEALAAKVRDALNVPLYTQGYHPPGSWQYDLSAVASGMWDEVQSKAKEAA